jgi:hypothetical protein
MKVVDYNDLCDIIERQREAEANGELTFVPYKRIKGHAKVKRGDPDYKGSSWNILVEWHDGTATYEPLGPFILDDPYYVAQYAHSKGLLNTPGWKTLRRYAKNIKKMNKRVNALRSTKTKLDRKTKVYKYGYEVPQSYRRALEIDKENGNDEWHLSMREELDTLWEYTCFLNCGKASEGAKPPDGHQRIRVHFVYDRKSDGRAKSRLVAQGNMLDPPRGSTYAGVAMLRSVRLVTFLSELNNLSLFAIDLKNAYITAEPIEKVYFVAGPEFQHGSQNLEGCVLQVVKALYGLRSSGKAFGDYCKSVLREMGFIPTKADPEILMRDAGDCYEYLALYVDDVLGALKNPKEFMETISSPPYSFQFKGGGEPDFHLGGSFQREADGTLLYNAKKYIARLVERYRHVYGEDPPKANEPMGPDIYPELDESDLCNEKEITEFQSLLGACQWCITLCRLDICAAILCLNAFSVCPRRNHLKYMKNIVGYLACHDDWGIRFRTKIPDYSHLQVPTYDWASSVYGSPEEQIPSDAPPPKGKCVRTTTFKDANLLHNRVTGRSCTGILHLVNQTPLDWYCKRQGQVETSSYGSEMVSCRIACEQIMDIRYTLRMLGVPLEGPAWLFGDNKGVVDSVTIPHSKLAKRWVALSYHRAREAIASGYVNFLHLEGRQNPSDTLTKNLRFSKMKDLLEPIMNFAGDTLNYIS